MPLDITVSRAIERAALIALLREVAEGATITYPELSAAAGLDVRRDGKHALSAAREDVRDEDRIVFEPVVNVGLRRMTQIELATVQPDRRRRRIQNQSRTELKELAAVREDDLAAGERQQFLAHLAQAGAVAAIATHRALRRLIGFGTPDGKCLPVDQALSALREIK